MRPVPTVILGVPILSTVRVDVQLMNHFTKYFGVVTGRTLIGQALRDRIDTTTLVSFGRFRLADEGDEIRKADLIAHDPIARDNSFVRVRLPCAKLCIWFMPLMLLFL